MTLSNLAPRRPKACHLSLIALVFLTVCLLAPTREMPLEDDWAYARTVESLVQHGRYQLHPWISANMPFQAAWGALFVLILGPEFGPLRISTIVLSVAGLLACYQLLRDSGRTEVESSLGVLVLWSSPLYLRFSFNFMTDVPFTSLMLVSLWLFTRAWTRMSPWWMAAAAMAGTATILTRQFAVAIIPALLLVAWLRRSAPGAIRLAAIGVAPLVLAAAYQIASGVLTPTWAQDINLRAQHALMSSWREMLGQLAWRPGVLVQYLCLFTLPLWVGVSVQLIADGVPASLRSARFVWISAAAVLVSGASLAIGLATHKPVILPTIPWNLEGIDYGIWAPRLVTVATWIGAVLLTAVMAITIWRDFEARTPAAVLIHATMICLLPMTLIYHDFGDEYLLVYIPWIVWTAVRAIPLRARSAILSVAAAGVLQLAVAVVWVDYIMAYNQVQWQAAEIAVERFHVPQAKVYAGWTWSTYYAFDDYVARFPSAGQVNFDTLFNQWLPQMEKEADYRVKVGYADPSAPGDENVARRRRLVGGVLEARPVHFAR